MNTNQKYLNIHFKISYKGIFLIYITIISLMVLYGFRNQYYIMEASNNKWFIMSSNDNTKDLLRKHLNITN